MMRTTTPILSILIAIMLFIFFTHPEYVETEKIRKEIAEYNEAKDTYRDFSNKLEEKLAKKGERSAYEIERLNRFIPTEIDETQHLVDLEALAKKHNMLFGNTDVEEKDFALTRRSQEEEATVPGDELTMTNISFEVVGTYTQFKNLLRDLEQSIALYEITGISFSVVDGPFQQFSVGVRTYARPDSSN